MTRDHSRTDQPKREIRMIACGEERLIGDLAPLSDLRTRWFDGKRAMADLLWVEDPLIEPTTKKAMAAASAEWQIAQSGFNKIYLQIAGRQVIDNIAACHVAFFRRLAGGLRFCDAKNAPVKDKWRAFVAARCPERLRPWRWVPEGVEPIEADFDVLRKIVEKADQREAGGKGEAADGIVAAMRKVATGATSFGAVPDAIIREIHRMALARLGKPDYAAVVGAKGVDDRIAQIHLDFRVIALPAPAKIIGGPKKTQGLVREVLDGLMATAGAGRTHADPKVVYLGEPQGRNQSRRTHGVPYVPNAGRIDAKAVIDVSHPIPRQPAIPIPVRITPGVADRFQEAEARCLTLEIGPETVKILAAFAKETVDFQKATPEGPAPIRRVLARDYGLTNTVSLAVLEFAEAMDEETAKTAMAFDKTEAKGWLSTRQAPAGMKILHQEHIDGRAFVAAMEGHEKDIAELSSHIDGVFAKMHAIKVCINRALHRPDEAFLGEKAVPEDAFLIHLHEKFFRLLPEARRLVAQRKAHRAAMAGLKRSWFGHLSNLELALVRKFSCDAVVREDLSYTTGAKGSKEWLGKAMAKKINWTARGFYARSASEKLAWHGVRELVVPSFYTSSACVKDGVFSPKSRKGEVFSCPVCGKSHADENAAITIGAYFWLCLKTPEPSSSLESPCDKRGRGNAVSSQEEGGSADAPYEAMFG